MNGAPNSHCRNIYETTTTGSSKPTTIPHEHYSPVRVTSENELLELLATGSVKEVDCCFSDPLGQWQHCSFHPSMVRA